MEGYSLLRQLRETLNETSTSTFLNDRTSFDFLYTAVQDFNFKTHYITGTQTINILAGTSTYALNPDYIGLALWDRDNRSYIKWTTGGNDQFIYQQDYANVVLENNTSTASVPSGFSVISVDRVANITGTATSIGTSASGEATLTDTGSDFTNVTPGDFVHNTTQSTDGIVVQVNSTSQVVTSLFNDGTSGSSWAVGNAYVIVPQPRWNITFSPTPSSSATVTIVYIKRPDPVYSLYRAYNLPFNYMSAIVQFAAFMYKYRDREPNFGDSMFKYYDGFVRKIAAELRRGTGERQGMRVNFQKVNGRSRTIGNWSR